MTSIARFVTRLEAISLPNVFNPYSDRCDLHDLEAAASIRRRNLEKALEAARSVQVGTFWVARDLGYRGGRRTGLALTDEAHLGIFGGTLGGIRFERATKGEPAKERTATTIWQMATRVAEPIFMWNAFPLHPHEAGNPLTNRCHSRAERDATAWVLPELMKLLQPRAIYTIGGDARKCLDALGVEATAFRHPSYGGQPQFIREVEYAYALGSSAAEPCTTQLALDVGPNSSRSTRLRPSA